MATKKNPKSPAKKVSPKKRLKTVLGVPTETILFQWTQKARAFTPRSQEYWVTTFAIAALACFILYIIEGLIPALVVIALVFLFYILNTVKPEIIEYKITNKGFRVADKFTNYSEFFRFWFSQKNTDEVLVFETFVMPYRLEVVINSNDKTKIRNALKNYLVEEEPPATRSDKLTDWFSKKLPMN